MAAIKLNNTILFRSALCGTSSDAKALMLGLLSAADNDGLADSGFVCKIYDLPNGDDLCAELVAADAIIALGDRVVAIKQWPALKVRKDIKTQSAFPSQRKMIKIQDDQYALIDSSVSRKE